MTVVLRHGLAAETREGFECRCGERFTTETKYVAHLRRLVGPGHPEIPDGSDFEADWMSVRENLPPEETPVLCYSPQRDEVFIDRVELDPGVPHAGPGLYWMPLPEPPGGNSGRGSPKDPEEALRRFAERAKEIAETGDTRALNLLEQQADTVIHNIEEGWFDAGRE